MPQRDTNSTNSLTLLPSLAGEGLLGGIDTMWSSPVAGRRHTVCPVGAPRFPVSSVADTWMCRSLRSQPHSSCYRPLHYRYQHMQTHTLWTAAIRGLTKSVYPVACLWIPSPPATQRTGTDIQKHVSGSRLISRPYGLSGSLLPCGPNANAHAHVCTHPLSHPSRPGLHSLTA